MLYPRVVRRRYNLEDIDIAISRPNYTMQYPDKLYMAYIEKNEVKIASTHTVNRIPIDWKYEYTIAENATDCAIEFDGYWRRFGKARRLVTIGMPWVFWIDMHGSILAKKLYSEDEPLYLSNIFEGNAVAKNLVAMRGWKSIERRHEDQGLILAYIKNGMVAYRNLCEQTDGRIIWESQKYVDKFPTPVNKVSLFRGNDYRVGILAEANKKIYMAVTKRNYGVMGIEDEIISATIKDYNITLIPIMGYVIGDFSPGTHNQRIDGYYRFGSNDSEKISASITNYNLCLRYAMADNKYLSAYNVGDTEIHTTLKYGLNNVLAQQFYAEDENNTPFAILGVSVEGDCYGNRYIVIHTDKFNNAVGDITVKFLGSGATKGEAGQDVNPFQITFTPVGLEPDDIEPPEVYDIWNE